MIENLRPKLVMIGMDAAELSFVQRHISSLPALKRILNSGTLHRLASTAGVFPGSVWPTFYSGTLPGEHGIYHHLQWDAETMRLRRVTEEWLYVEPFWYELERRGLRVATIDVPMSFPSRLRRGVEVINWGSHDELGPFRTYPAHLGAEIRGRFGRHPMGSEIPVRKSPDQLGKIRRNLIAGAKLKGSLSRWILAQADYDFFLTVFGETHRGGHLLWPEEGAPEDSLLDVYRAVDRSIGELMEALPKSSTTIILFALHGMGSNDSQEHFVPKLMDRVNAGFLGQAFDGNGGLQVPGGQRSAMRMLRENLPAGLQNAVARAVPVGLRDLVVTRQISAGHDWSRTPGFALLADLNGYLRWNLKGRERRGMLDQGDKIEQYAGWVHQCFTELNDPETGTRLVKDMLLTRNHFPGRRIAMLPDAVVAWAGLPPSSRVVSDSIGSMVAEPSTGRAGNHRSDGFCVVLEPSTLQAGRNSPPRHIAELSTFVFDKLNYNNNPPG